MSSQVKVYGADWCPMTTRVRRFLDEAAVPYKYINIDNDPEAAAWVAAQEQNHGKEKKPTIDVAGEVLTTPSNQKLAQVLQSKGLLAAVEG